MATIVVRIQDNHRVASASPAERLGLWRRGDVVEILDDGVDPGRKVHESPRLKVVRIPGADKTEFAGLLAGGPNGVGRRAARWAIERLPLAMQRRFDDADDIELTPQQAAFVRDFLEARGA